MLRAKRRRTRTHRPDGNPIFNTMNSTPLQSAYVNVNNNLKQSICCNKTIACQYDNCGTVTYVPENITISIFGPTTRDPDMIIDGVYVLVSDLNTSPVYYNKDKNLYLGVNKGDISSPPLQPHPPGNQGRYWGIGHNYPSSNTAKWYFMYTNGNLLNEYSTDLYKQDGALLWSMGVATDGMLLTDIKPNFAVTIKKSEQYKCCLSSQNRNPILGYRKQLDCTRSIVSATDVYKKLPTNTVYKDNYAKTCGTFRFDNVIGIDDQGNLIVNKSKSTNTKLCGYSQTKPHIQNRNGWMNDKYNYSSKQYLERRCRGFNNLAFNYLSNSSIKESSNSEFLTGCSNARVNIDPSYNQGNKDCSGNCDLSCNNILGLDCTVMNCSQQMDKSGNIICAKKGYTVCEATNNNCKAIYKRSNPRFSSQGGVSGGSRINRLKYQTQLKAQSTRKLVTGQNGTNKTSAKNTNRGSMSFDNHVNSVNGFGGASNGSYPGSLYRNTYPTYKANLSGVCLGKSLTFNGLPQRCKMPEEKPSCRALQTLPQRCNFRCNTRHNCDPNKLKRFK